MIRLLASLLFAMLPVFITQADDLGRLFFTPEQRTQLDREHAQQTSAEDKHTTLTLNGIVQKTGGARTVWINGKAQDMDGRGKQTPDTHILTIPEQSQPIAIKVGQRLLLEQAATK